MEYQDTSRTETGEMPEAPVLEPDPVVQGGLPSQDPSHDEHDRTDDEVKRRTLEEIAAAENVINIVQSAVKIFNGEDLAESRPLSTTDAVDTADLENTTSPKEVVDQAIHQIEDSFGEWRKLRGHARAALWSALGEIYELAEVIRLTAGAEAALVTAVKGHSDVKQSAWSPEGKEVADLLLVASLGLKSKETKSQWLKSIKAAESLSIPHTRLAFIQFLETNNGIIAAGNLLTAGNGDKNHKSFKVEDFVQDIRRRVTASDTIKVEIDQTTDLSHDMCVLLLHRKFDREGMWTGEFEVVAKLGNPDIVSDVAAAVQAGRTQNPVTDAVRKTEADALRDINMVTLKKSKGGGIKGQLTIEDMRAFVEGIRALQARPALSAKYFQGPTGFNVEMDDRPSHVRSNKATPKDQRKNGNDLGVMNGNCPEYDPARYIQSAIPGALVPYNPNDDKAAATFVNDNFVAYRAKIGAMRAKCAKNLKKT